MTDHTNLIMVNTPEEINPETGISMEKIQEIQRERKRKDNEKRLTMGCWDCGKKLTTWDHDLSVVELGSDDVGTDRQSQIQHIRDMVNSILKQMVDKGLDVPDDFGKILGRILMMQFYPVRRCYIGVNTKLRIVKKKIAGLAYLCYTCKSEAKVASDEVTKADKCFFCGKEESPPRGCGVSICETCMEPVGGHITDITSHGDGLMSKDEEINLVRDWWFAGRGLLSCLMELEMFQRTENVKRLRELREELLEEQRIGIITEEEQNHILELMNDVVKETQKEDGEPVEMAAGLYGAIEGLMMKALYHNHPLKKADIQLEPGIYELEGKRPEGLDTFRWTVSDAPVVLRRIPEPTVSSMREIVADVWRPEGGDDPPEVAEEKAPAGDGDS